MSKKLQPNKSVGNDTEAFCVLIVKSDSNKSRDPTNLNWVFLIYCNSRKRGI